MPSILLGSGIRKDLRVYKKLATLALGVALAGWAGYATYDNKTAPWRALEDVMAVDAVADGLSCNTRQTVVELAYAGFFLGMGQPMLDSAMEDGSCYVMEGLVRIDKVHRLLMRPDGQPFLVITLKHEGKTSWGIYVFTPKRPTGPKEQDASVSETQTTSRPQRVLN